MALRTEPLAQAASPVARRRGRADTVVGDITVGGRQPVFGRLALDVGRLTMVPTFAGVTVAGYRSYRSRTAALLPGIF